MSNFDRDRDGNLTREEMPPRLAPAFGRFDSDGNGLVSKAELADGLALLQSQGTRRRR